MDPKFSIHSLHKRRCIKRKHNSGKVLFFCALRKKLSEDFDKYRAKREVDAFLLTFARVQPVLSRPPWVSNDRSCMCERVQISNMMVDRAKNDPAGMVQCVNHYSLRCKDRRSMYTVKHSWKMAHPNFCDVAIWKVFF